MRNGVWTVITHAEPLLTPHGYTAIARRTSHACKTYGPTQHADIWAKQLGAWEHVWRIKVQYVMDKHGTIARIATLTRDSAQGTQLVARPRMCHARAQLDHVSMGTCMWQSVNPVA